MPIIPRNCPPPGWYSTTTEYPHGKLTLVTASFDGRKLVVYELRPWTAPDGSRKLVCYRERVFPGDVRRDCTEPLQFPPPLWRGMPTAEAVATTEARAK